MSIVTLIHSQERMARQVLRDLPIFQAQKVTPGFQRVHRDRQLCGHRKKIRMQTRQLVGAKAGTSSDLGTSQTMADWIGANMTTIADQLRAAKALIDTPEKWCQGANAQDQEGEPVNPFWDRACKFDSSGALSKADVSWRCDDLLDAKMDGAMNDFNDTHTHAEVMAAWDRAIQAAEKAG